MIWKSRPDQNNVVLGMTGTSHIKTLLKHDSVESEQALYVKHDSVESEQALYVKHDSVESEQALYVKHDSVESEQALYVKHDSVESEQALYAKLYLYNFIADVDFQHYLRPYFYFV